jgi:hypothetical protein
MFVTGIDRAGRFTRAIHTIVRYFGSDFVEPGAGTLFFVNADGWALTCKHVAMVLVESERIAKQRVAFLEELSASKGGKKMSRVARDLEQKYGFAKGKPFEVLNNFRNCVDQMTSVRITVHPDLDLALLKFESGKVLCDAFPLFAARGDELKQGKSICRLGFPFPEFTNFRYDPNTESISWTKEGRQDSPRFPLEGMVTRHLAGAGGAVIGFEMSTPGLRGQSGGPAFDTEGRIWGMQSATNHLDLAFDVDMEVVREGRRKRVQDSAFLHVGHCIHVNVMKEFMRANGVAFSEG